jgi:hypothetical protein
MICCLEAHAVTVFHTVHSSLMPRLQFGLVMCQASLLAEGNLNGTSLGKSSA